MKIKQIHDWDVSTREARAIQTELAGRIVRRRLGSAVRLAAGLDCAFSADKQRIGAVIVVLSYPEFEMVEVSRAIAAVTFPYVPGLLTFREAPVCLEAAAGLSHKPDVFLIDGQGIAHPRRIGLASHLGLFLDAPTIGCAKSRLIGEYDPPGAKKGSYSLLKDKGETIGAVVRTRDMIKPLFVSPGHLCTLEDAVRMTLRCTTRYRLPEPTRLAHQEVTRMKPEI